MLNFMIAAVQIIGSVFILAIAAFAGVYAYRMISEEAYVPAAMWSLASGVAIALVFFRVFPGFFFAAALLSLIVFAVSYATNHFVAKRTSERRRQTYLDGKDF